MQSNESVRVFVAFVRGVAIALPQFATQMIKILGAEPAEEILVYEPEVVYRRSRHAAGIVLGGSSVKVGLRRPDENYDHNARPERSWKNHRSNRWRRIAIS